MAEMWHGFLAGLASALELFHTLLEPLAGPLAWGLAIVALTVAVRVLLLPLGVLQARTLRARRALAPEVERLQRRFDTSARLRGRDPERFMRNLRAQRTAVQALQREHSVRPGIAVAVLLAQSPVLFGLYRVLLRPELLPLLQAAPFLLIERLSLSLVTGAGVGAVLLLAVIAGTTFVGHWQTTRALPATPGAPNPALVGAVTTGLVTVVAATLPAGLLVYWATSGLWTVGQQALLLR